MGSTSRDDPADNGDASARTPSRSFVAAVREPIIVAIFVLAGIFEVLSGDLSPTAPCFLRWVDC